MERPGKIVGVMVFIMVVGLAIGIVAVVRLGNSNDNKGYQGGGVSTSKKALLNIDVCARALDKESCEATLRPLSNSPIESLKNQLSFILNGTLGELRKAIDVTMKVIVNKDNDPYHDQMGIDDCKEFLGYAVDELETSIFTIGDNGFKKIQDRVHEFISYLTGVLIYQQTCIDQLVKPEYKDPIRNGLRNVSRLAESAIYMFAEIKNIASKLDFTAGLDTKSELSPTPASRHLLQPEKEAHKSGYPSWITTKDRRLLQAGPAAGGPDDVRPNAVVAQDGSGQFRTINDAINSIPAPKKDVPDGERFVIYVKAGIYNEIVLIKKKPNVFIYGDGPGKTIITGDLSVALKGVKTSNSATIGVDSDWFMIKSVTIRNTAGPDGHQAVALRIAGQNAVVFDCSLEGYQDTLYYHKGVQFYKNCVISGSVDFIFGNGRTVIQDSLIIVRKPNPNQSNMVTADGGLTPQGEHGLVLQNCKIVAEKELMAEKARFKTYLGRPWKAFAVTVFMQNDIDDFIVPEGYSIFTNVGEGSQNQDTALYGEYQNTGPGANTDRRDKNTFKNWHLLSRRQARRYTTGSFLHGGAWLGSRGVPYKVGI